jgi:hypothetical protein
MDKVQILSKSECYTPSSEKQTSCGEITKLSVKLRFLRFPVFYLLFFFSLFKNLTDFVGKEKGRGRIPLPAVFTIRTAGFITGPSLIPAVASRPGAQFSDIKQTLCGDVNVNSVYIGNF